MDGFDLPGLRHAIEAKDADRWLAFFAEDAEWLEYRHADPPARPNRMRGREEIGAFLRRVAEMPVALSVEAMVGAGDAAAYRLWADLPDRRRVVEQVMLELRAGKIVRQIDVEAWDPDKGSA
jgi:hypothetical protein